MTFGHKTVAEIEAHTSKLICEQQRDTSVSDEERAQLALGASMLEEGFYVERNLAEFCNALRPMFRGVKFGRVAGTKNMLRPSMRVPAEVWMYMPGDEYAPVRIGYADYAVRSTKYTFSVYARGITNQKFAPHRDHHHMKLSENVKAAIAAVRKNFRRYTTQELAVMSFDELGSRLSQLKWNASRAASDTLGTLTNHEAFLSEMQALCDSGYQFTHPTFAAAIRDAVGKAKEQAIRYGAQAHAWYVYVRDGLNGQEVDVIEVTDVPKRGEKYLLSAPKVTYTDNTPEDIAAKVASLSMLDKDAFVDGLGMKIDDNKFWVLR